MGTMKLSWWQKALALSVLVLVLLLLKNPDAAAFTFLLDATLFDVFVLLLSIQLQMFGLSLFGLWFALKTRVSSKSKGNA